MARESRDSRTLRELYDALGNDPTLIAETLVRPRLVDRLVQNWYANDDRFHGPTRLKAERALAGCHDVACMDAMGGEYAEMTTKLERVAAPGGVLAPGVPSVKLDAEQWKSHLDHLAATIGGSPESITTRRPGSLEETAGAFVVTATLSQTASEIVTASTSWPKRPFDAWWKKLRATMSTDVEPVARSFRLPALDPAGCTGDTWSPTHQDVPDARAFQTAVWTGAEMIVWGGGNRY
jgi:hypothetical protein